MIPLVFVSSYSTWPLCDTKFISLFIVNCCNKSHKTTFLVKYFVNKYSDLHHLNGSKIAEVIFKNLDKIKGSIISFWITPSSNEVIGFTIFVSISSIMFKTSFLQNYYCYEEIGKIEPQIYETFQCCYWCHRFYWQP